MKKTKGYSTLSFIVKWTITIFLSLGALICLFFVLSYGADEMDKQYCYTLQAQAEQYINFSYSKVNEGGFYITKADKEFCDHLKIIIKAPVR